MRRVMVVLLLASTFTVGSSTPVVAGLPAAACNQGTMNAHERVPETTGTGAVTPGHEAIPEAEGGTCGHGG